MLKNLSNWTESGPEIFDDQVGITQPGQENLAMRLLAQPKMVVGLAISLCLLASITYAGVGYFWLSGQNDPAKDGAIAMAGIEESVDLGDASGGFNKAAYNTGRQIAPSSELAVIALDNSLKQSTDNEIFALQATDSEVFSTGSSRPDPLAPLVVPPTTGATSTGPVVDPNAPPPPPPDPITFLQFTGYIGDLRSKDRVAVIRVSDNLQGDYTVIKKIGETFLLNGDQVWVRGIGRDAIWIQVQGKQRHLDINPFVEVSSSAGSSGGGAASGGGTAAGGGGGAASGGGAAGAAPAGGAAAGASAGGATAGGAAKDPTNPRLAEPSGP